MGKGRTRAARYKTSPRPALDLWPGCLDEPGVTFVSTDVERLENGGKAAAIRDPDGHMIVPMA
jgi:hypothetical protein